ncbi:23333_t:CDS:2, partial [Gigaspora margarita]
RDHLLNQFQKTPNQIFACERTIEEYRGNAESYFGRVKINHTRSRKLLMRSSRQKLERLHFTSPSVIIGVLDTTNSHDPIFNLMPEALQGHVSKQVT